MDGRKKNNMLGVRARIRQLQAVARFRKEMAAQIECAQRLGTMDARSLDELQGALFASALPFLAKGEFPTAGWMSLYGCLKSLRTPGSSFVTVVSNDCSWRNMRDGSVVWGNVVDAAGNTLSVLRT